jgi:hypothetical protein
MVSCVESSYNLNFRTMEPDRPRHGFPAFCYHPAVLFLQYPTNPARQNSMCFPKILEFQFFLTVSKIYICEVKYGEQCIRFIHTAGFDNVAMRHNLKKKQVLFQCVRTV